MLKLRFSEPVRRQYMDGKISLCKYECTVFDNSNKCIVAQFSATGTAKCSPNDKVNPEFGAKLADSRAKLSAYRKAAHILPDEVIDEWVEKINHQVDMLDFIDQMQYLKKKEISHIEEICVEA